MNPSRLPKGTQNRPKSAKMLPGTPPERVWRRSLEKIVSQSLPETPSYASRAVNTMVFSLPRKYHEAPFELHFGSILEASWPLLVPTSRPGSEKGTSKKNIEKRLGKKYLQVPKWSQKWFKSRPNPDHFWHLFSFLRKKCLQVPKWSQKDKIQTKSRPLLASFFLPGTREPGGVHGGNHFRPAVISAVNSTLHP